MLLPAPWGGETVIDHQKTDMGEALPVLRSKARATTDVVFLAQGDTGWSVQIVARYHDLFRQVGGKWLLSRRADEYIGWQPPG